ncbi:MAG: HPr family phosphocarrier protein [Defluviitaleaceae bacterium]|nr:HPr family phosphocarrier protein [Defluviitaleaceae bacterium]
MAYVTRTFTIQHTHGLHVRPAGALVSACRPFDADVALKFNNVEYNLKSVLGIVSAGIRCGDVVEFVARGPQADLAMDAVLDAVKSSLGGATQRN